MSGLYTSVEGQQAVQSRYSQMLARWPAPCEQRTVPTREGETFVVACGPASAPAVLLLQGSGANAAMWLRDIAAWAQRHRVYAVDAIGEPGFSAASRPPLASGAYALWLEDVMQALGLTRASLVGISLGGWIVVDFAIRRPERVDKLILISPSGVGRAKASFMFKAAGLLLLGPWGRRKAMAMAVGPVSERPEPIDREVGMLALLIAKHFRYRRETVPQFGDEALKRLTMPVLAILGSQDALLDSQGTKRRLEQFVPLASVHLLPGVGHVVRDRTDAVLAFLDG